MFSVHLVNIYIQSRGSIYHFPVSVPRKSSPFSRVCPCQTRLIHSRFYLLPTGFLIPACRKISFELYLYVFAYVYRYICVPRCGGPRLTAIYLYWLQLLLLFSGSLTESPAHKVCQLVCQLWTPESCMTSL